MHGVPLNFSKSDYSQNHPWAEWQSILRDQTMPKSTTHPRRCSSGAQLLPIGSHVLGRPWESLDTSWILSTLVYSHFRWSTKVERSTAHQDIQYGVSYCRMIIGKRLFRFRIISNCQVAYTSDKTYVTKTDWSDEKLLWLDFNGWERLTDWMALSGLNAPYFALGHVYLQHLAFNDLEIDDSKARDCLRCLFLRKCVFKHSY